MVAVFATVPESNAVSQTTQTFSRGLGVNLLLFDREEVAEDGTAVVRDVRARHLRDVLRAEPGQTVRVGLADGPKGTGTVVEVGPGGVRLACAFEPCVPERPAVDVLLALPRPKVLRRLWAQMAALGVGRILLTAAWKVERGYFDSHAIRPETYRPLLVEGLQQAQDTRVPDVRIWRRFATMLDEALGDPVANETRWLADPAADTSASAVAATGCDTERLLVAVGPEGGWTAQERASLEARGFRGVSMGARTLRSDTACVALLALAHAARRENGS